MERSTVLRANWRRGVPFVSFSSLFGGRCKETRRVEDLVWREVYWNDGVGSDGMVGYRMFACMLCCTI